MAMRCVVTSPFTTADFRKSTRSEAFTLPSNLPWITTVFALTSALTFPFGPTVRLWLRSSIFPSTLPSTYKSSEPDSSPLITTDFPMWAPSPVCGASMLWPPRDLFAANEPIVNHSARLRSATWLEIILHQELTAAAGRAVPLQCNLWFATMKQAGGRSKRGIRAQSHHGGRQLDLAQLYGSEYRPQCRALHRPRERLDSAAHRGQFCGAADGHFLSGSLGTGARSSAERN